MIGQYATVSFRTKEQKNARRGDGQVVAGASGLSVARMASNERIGAYKSPHADHFHHRLDRR